MTPHHSLLLSDLTELCSPKKVQWIYLVWFGPALQSGMEASAASVHVLTHSHAEDVRLQLHQQPVGRHPSVHLQPPQGNPAVLVHGIQNLSDHKKAQSAVTGGISP